MYNVENTEYGFRITASGVMDISEAEKLLMELLQTLSSHNRQFSLIVDLRDLVPLKSEVMQKVRQIHDMSKKMSLQRAALIIKSPVLKTQGIQISFDAATASCDRYIDASKVDDWEAQALAWVLNAVEPVQKFKKIHT